MDETGFMVGMLKACQVLVPREIKACYTRNPQNRELVTCVECISAAGEYIPSYIVIKGEHIMALWFKNAAADGHDLNTVWTDYHAIRIYGCREGIRLVRTLRSEFTTTPRRSL
jgi:hypothetical protein